jgi:hypothetical protein
MPAQKYSVNQHPIQTLLTWITEKEIAIPEIQRPFVLRTMGWDYNVTKTLASSTPILPVGSCNLGFQPRNSFS